MPRNGISALARVLDRAQFALDAARAETGRDQDAVRAAQHVDAFVLDQFRVDALDVDRRVMKDARRGRAPR